MRQRTSSPPAHDRCGCLNAVEAGHFEVHERNVDVGCSRNRECLFAVRDLGNDVDVVFETQERREGAAHHRLVVRYKNPDHIRTCTVVPSSPPVSVSVPPAPSTLSRRPRRPFPLVPENPTPLSVMSML